MNKLLSRGEVHAFTTSTTVAIKYKYETVTDINNGTGLRVAADVVSAVLRSSTPKVVKSKASRLRWAGSACFNASHFLQNPLTFPGDGDACTNRRPALTFRRSKTGPHCHGKSTWNK